MFSKRSVTQGQRGFKHVGTVVKSPKSMYLSILFKLNECLSTLLDWLLCIPCVWIAAVKYLLRNLLITWTLIPIYISGVDFLIVKTG